MEVCKQRKRQNNKTKTINKQIFILVIIKKMKLRNIALDKTILFYSFVVGYNKHSKNPIFCNFPFPLAWVYWYSFLYLCNGLQTKSKKRYNLFNIGNQWLDYFNKIFCAISNCKGSSLELQIFHSSFIIEKIVSLTQLYVKVRLLTEDPVLVFLYNNNHHTFYSLPPYVIDHWCHCMKYESMITLIITARKA